MRKNTLIIASLLLAAALVSALGSAAFSTARAQSDDQRRAPAPHAQCQRQRQGLLEPRHHLHLDRRAQ